MEDILLKSLLYVQMFLCLSYPVSFLQVPNCKFTPIHLYETEKYDFLIFQVWKQ